MIRDILHRLEDRFPVHVLLWPVPVQGEGAAGKIAAAIAGFNAMDAPSGPRHRRARRRLDRGFVGVQRGGRGARRRRLRAMPIISAVGHETDTSLTDFAADVRAPTPTAAAEMAVPVRAELAHRCASSAAAPNAAPDARTNARREQLETSLRTWPKPADLLAPQRQRLDELAERLPRGLRGRLDRARGELGHAAGALRPGLLVAAHARARERLDALWRVAELAHPSRPLTRGYARVEDRAGKTLISAAAAREARRLRLVFHDGPVEASVDGADPRPASKRAKVDQPKLL